MNAATIIGWADGCDVLCPECGEKRGLLALGPDEREDRECAPLFAAEEWDRVPSCDDCSTVLDVRLTPDGITWVRDALLRGGSIPAETLRDILAHHGEDQ